MDRLNGHFPMTYKGHEFKVYFEMYPENNQVFLPPIYGDDFEIMDQRKVEYNLEDLSKLITSIEKGLDLYEGELNHNTILAMVEDQFLFHGFWLGRMSELDKLTYFRIACIIFRYLLESLGKLDSYNFGHVILAYGKIDSIEY